MIGDGLEEFAYSLTTELDQFAPLNARLMLMRIFYLQDPGRPVGKGSKVRVTDPV